MSDPAISIIIPCFNRATMVADAIRSALAQGPGVETIVIDDGSTDDSWEVISSFPAIIAERTANAGVSAARNRGLGLATGKFVKFLDSDDLLPENAVRAMLELAVKQAPRDIAVGTAAVQSSSAAPPTYGFAPWTPSGPIPPSLLLRYTMPSGLPLFPRQALKEAGGFDGRLSIGEDYALAAKLHALGYRFVQHSASVYIVRDHTGERLSRRYGAEGFRKQLATHRAVLDLLGPAASDEIKSVGQAAWALARDASRQGFRPEAEALFALADGIGALNVRVAPGPLRLLYRVLSPYAAERLLEAAKRTVRPQA